MRQLPALVIAIATAIAAILTPAAARADPVDITAAARSVARVVLIVEEDGEPTLVGHGSGFAVAPDIILTNAHVVEPARIDDTIRIGIVPPQGKGGWFGRVIAFAPKSDLALIKLTERGTLPPATFLSGAVGDGADVVAVGYPGNVDVAQGLNVGDIVSPTAPVKTRGSVSSGRSSKSFETILHTAPIGSGNSGGPLLDSCGRVIGANSFGTLSSEGDSEFYFAVSGREILRFLRASEITPRITALPCRSLADLDRAEAERATGERIMSDEEARALTAKQRAAAEKAERAALFAVMGERENRMAIALLAVLLAFAGGGAAIALHGRKRPRDARIAGGAAMFFVAAALAAWLARPGFAEIDIRAKQSVADAAAGSKAAPGRSEGEFTCTIDLARSRVITSGTDEMPLAWRADGCAGGNRQFALTGDGWSQITLSDTEDSATVARFDPLAGTYRADRYFLELDAMSKLRQEGERIAAPACGGGEDAARKLGEAQAALKALLPERPNERLHYECR